MSNGTSCVGKRRSGRIAQEVAIYVSGIDLKGMDFFVPTRTQVLSRYGAKILLNQALVPEQEISIYYPETRKEWDARVVALFTTEPEGHSYGVEFLDQTGNFWNIPFPSAPVPMDWMNKMEVAAVASVLHVDPMPTLKIHEKVALEEAREAPSAKDFAVRLKCAHRESEAPSAKDFAVRLKCAHGEEDQWLVLQNREESLQQILDTSWDFECPVHGAQREFPLEAMEAGQGLPPSEPRNESRGFKEVSDESAGTLSAERTHREPRTVKSYRVWVRGEDARGNPFFQSAYTINISRSGGRLNGLGLVTRPGGLLEVKHRWRKAYFSVVWTGHRGTPQANQIGISCLEPNKNIWGLPETALGFWHGVTKQIRRLR